MDLIIDTSSDKLKLILTNNNIVTESEETNSKHLKHLLPEIERILVKSGKELNNVDVFSVVIGPGSFTGVRIGVSTLKAFGCVLKDKKYIAINMLELLGFTIIKKLDIKTNFYVVIKSTSTKYYFALCNLNGQVKKMGLVTIEELINLYKNENLPLFSYNSNLEGSEITSTQIELSTEDYLKFVKNKKDENAFSSLFDIKPLYLALSQAEEELNKRIASGSKNS